MYGSSLMRVTLRPRDSRIAAREAEAIPLPREDTTPPVTKTNLVMSCGSRGCFRVVVMRDYTGRGLPPEAGQMRMRSDRPRRTRRIREGREKVHAWRFLSRPLRILRVLR